MLGDPAVVNICDVTGPMAVNKLYDVIQSLLVVARDPMVVNMLYQIQFYNKESV